jgi:hypothetical protein
MEGPAPACVGVLVLEVVRRALKRTGRDRKAVFNMPIIMDWKSLVPVLGVDSLPDEK